MLKDVSEQRKKSNVDWLFVILIAVTLLINLIVLSSASSNVVEGDPYFYLKRQGLWIAIGAVLFFLVSRFNYEKFRRMDLLLYGIIIILLIAVLFTPETKGAHRWFDLGFIDFQPSELAKIVLIVVFACFLARNQGRLHEPKKIVTALVMMLIPWGLILIEPDLGDCAGVNCGYFNYGLCRRFSEKNSFYHFIDYCGTGSVSIHKPVFLYRWISSAAGGSPGLATVKKISIDQADYFYQSLYGSAECRL
jgi:hypothetical protein